MASFSLDDIKAAADKKYGHTDIDDVRLLNPLRLPKEKRDELVSTQELLKDENADQAAILEDVLRIAAEDKKKVEALIKEVGGDLAVLMGLMETYMGETEVGEASASES